MSDKKTNSKGKKWTRRAFIGVGGLAGVGLLVGVGGNMHMNKAIKKYSGKGLGDGASVNAWIRIAPDNSVTLAVARAEMGQGVYTAVPQLIAEELEIPMNIIKVVHPQPESPYANTYVGTQIRPDMYKGYDMMSKVYAFLPVVATGGSTTIINDWINMRYAGATAREMLKTAAAQQWGIAVSECDVAEGYVINKKSGDKLSYGSLAAAAATIELDGLPELKPKKDFKKIGHPIQRLDIPEKVTGDAEFGLDVRMDGMLYAAVKHPSTIGGKILSISNEEEVLKMPGVKKVIITPYGPAAVVATNTWLASNAVRALETEEDGANSDISTAQLMAQMEKILTQPPIAVKKDEGEVAAKLSEEGGKTVEGKYYAPYLAHATMEPMNATVLMKDGKVDAWMGHQAPSVAHNMLVESTGIEKANIKINTTYLGGGFGRRSEPDFVRVSGAIAKEMEGTPVQVVYTREEDMRNDMYRPAAMGNFKAKVNEAGDIEAWDTMLALQSVQNNALNRIMPAMAVAPKDDESTAEGIADLPYDMNGLRVAFGNQELPIQIGFWRSVGYSQNSFFAESFMDECAHAAGKDPYLFRKSKLKGKPRFEAVLDQVAKMANWNTPLSEGKSRGIALVKSFGSYVAEVVEVSKVGEKEFNIDKVYLAIDCGNVVNPDTVKAQMESGVIFGLTAALYGEITWSEGAVEQYNFPQYEMIRMGVCPQIDVHIMDVDEYPGGVGEPGTPPAAPALANALFAATGERVRSLPLTKSGYKFV